MIICLLIALLGFAIYAVSSIVTDRLLEQRIKRLEDFLKDAHVPFDYEHATITQDDFAENAGSDMTNGLTYKQSKCSTCINDKGCINCENGNQYENSLEAKGVNLKKEVRKYVQENFTIDKEQLDRFGIEEKDYMYSMDESDMLSIAKYFYELGLKAQKGE